MYNFNYLFVPVTYLKREENEWLVAISQHVLCLLLHLYGLDLVTCSNSELLSEIINQFQQLLWLLGQGISQKQGLYLHRTTHHRKTNKNMHSVSGIQTHELSDRAATGTGYVVYRYSLHVVFLRQLIRLVIRNRCDTSWHKVFIKNCYLNISTYTALYLLPMGHIKVLNLKSLFVQIIPSTCTPYATKCIIIPQFY
jgi:hypothetical protein